MITFFSSVAPVIDINTTGIVRVREGDPVVLPCYIESLPHSETRWVYSAGDSRQENLTYCGFKYSCILRIPSAKKKDSGKYTCLADNKIFSESSKDIELIVEGSFYSQLIYALFNDGMVSGLEPLSSVQYLSTLHIRYEPSYTITP